uniref:Photosystem II reaction center protein J n=1 Tax=Sciadococcus taiwanensis TaxID=3028030 RepID=A0A9Y1I255_9RHOD|nr:photosystem II protein J [Sciadococcus taiwanensis]
MTSTGRLPLWLVVTVGGMAVLTILGIFFYGAYSGLGSSL